MHVESIGHPWTPFFGNTICAASASHLRQSILAECAAKGTRPGKFALAQDVPYDDFPEEAEARNSEHTAWAMNLRGHMHIPTMLLLLGGGITTVWYNALLEAPC